MVDIKVLAQLFFSDTAFLASVLIALACLAALFIPVGAVVDGAVATFEVRVIQPAHNGQWAGWWVRFLPFVNAGFAAKFSATTFDLILWRAKRITTLLASAFDATVVIVAQLTAKAPPSLSDLTGLGDEHISAMLTCSLYRFVGWMIFGNFIFALPIAETALRTEALPLLLILDYLLSAIVAKHGWQWRKSAIEMLVIRAAPADSTGIMLKHVGANFASGLHKKPPCCSVNWAVT